MQADPESMSAQEKVCERNKLPAQATMDSGSQKNRARNDSARGTQALGFEFNITKHSNHADIYITLRHVVMGNYASPPRSQAPAWECSGR